MYVQTLPFSPLTLTKRFEYIGIHYDDMLVDTLNLRLYVALK